MFGGGGIGRRADLVSNKSFLLSFPFTFHMRWQKDISIQSHCQRFNFVQFILLEIRLLLYFYGDESKLKTEKLEGPCGCQIHNCRHLSENSMLSLLVSYSA